jgi:Phytanoyl-CoA dioxygenase (PhyH)
MPRTLAHGPTYDSLSEEFDDRDRPWLDRIDLDESVLDAECKAWRRDGVLRLPGLLPDELIEAYQARFEAYHCLGGFQTPTPYEVVAELRALSLFPPVVERINKLIGDEMILHLNLTGWVSTERKWHQDDYLNPPQVNGWYVAIWMALDDITPDAGPFQYIPGSHRWPVMRRDRVMDLMTPEQAAEDAAHPNSLWTVLTQDPVAAAVEQRRQELNAPIESFLARRGDVLIWHACLQHRGSEAVKRPGFLRSGFRSMPPRKALISHYTAESRGAFDVAVDATGGKYARTGQHINHLVGGDQTPLSWRINKRLDWALRQR